MVSLAETASAPVLGGIKSLDGKYAGTVVVPATPNGDVQPTTTNPVYPTSNTKFELEDHPIDEVRTIKAGFITQLTFQMATE
jgi:hypothetical protein